MPFLIDPKAGDCEDDASSTEQRRLLAIAGTMLAELSLVKLAVTWLLVVALPALITGLTIPVLNAWLSKVSYRVAAFTGLGSLLLLGFLAAVAWFGLRPLLRIAESNFWALHSIVVQPCYALAREGIRHISEVSLFAGSDEPTRAKARSLISLMAAALCVAIAWLAIRLAWPHTRWDASFGELVSIGVWLKPAIANAAVVISLYFGLFSVVSGISDALMDQPVRITEFDQLTPGGRTFRVAHISDLHVIGEPYGFRIESGRAGPQGNDQLPRLFAELRRIDERNKLDLILVTGDVTDAGRSAEWAAFFDALGEYPSLQGRMLVAPGNHDLNIVDRANPARLELPFSSWKRLRQIRTLSALAHIQGDRVHVFDRSTKMVGQTLNAALNEHSEAIKVFADAGSIWAAYKLAPVSADCFPLFRLPDGPDGFGVVILNSNADANFSFTNALGLVTGEDVAAIVSVLKEYPQAKWIVALHHHLVEYPMRVECFSERIGTSLINGSWFIQQLKPFSDRVILMHGHRHIDWIGACGKLKIVSAPSPVMRKHGYKSGSFLVHTLFSRPGGAIGLAEPTRVSMSDERIDELPKETAGA